MATGPTQKNTGEADETLAARVQAGERSAYRPLVERYAPMVFQLTRRFADNEHDAEDMAQEIFTKAYQSIESFERRARFSSWLYAIALNHCRDYAKRARRRFQDRRDAWDEAAAAQAAPTGKNPHRTLEGAEQVRALKRAICQLPESYAVPLLLRYNHDLPYRHMARMLGSTEGALKVRVHRARRKLRTLLEDYL